MHRFSFFLMTLLVTLIGLTQEVSGQSRPELEATFALGHDEIPSAMFVELTEVKFPAIKEALEENPKLVVIFDGGFSPEKHIDVESDTTLDVLGKHRANYVEDMNLGLERGKNARALAVQAGIPVERTRVGAFIGKPTERIVRITLREEGDYATRDELAAVAQIANEANERSKDNSAWNTEQNSVLSYHTVVLESLSERMMRVNDEVNSLSFAFLELGDNKPRIEWHLRVLGGTSMTADRTTPLLGGESEVLYGPMSTYVAGLLAFSPQAVDVSAVFAPGLQFAGFSLNAGAKGQFEGKVIVDPYASLAYSFDVGKANVSVRVAYTQWDITTPATFATSNPEEVAANEFEGDWSYQPQITTTERVVMATIAIGL